MSITAVSALIQQKINYYFALAFPTTGLLLSLFSFYIFTRPSLNKTNMGFLYLCQTAIDTLVLVWFVFVSRSAHLFGYNMNVHSDLVCRLLTLLRRVVLHMSSWTSVYITFDRFLYVYYPSGSKLVKKRKHTLLILLAIFACINVINMPNLFFYLDKSSNVTNSSNGAVQSLTATGTCRAAPALQSFTDILSTAMRTWLPITLMISLDTLIIRKLREKKSILKASGGGGSAKKPSGKKKKEQHYTNNVILMNFLFFFFNGPIAVMFLVETIRVYSNAFVMRELERAVYDISYQIAVNLSFAYQTLSFFFYAIFNHLYRRELLVLLGVRSAESLNNSIYQSHNSVRIRPSLKTSSTAIC
jgi:hypothetical protein